MIFNDQLTHEKIKKRIAELHIKKKNTMKKSTKFFKKFTTKMLF